jgi:hypothetical protein
MEILDHWLGAGRELSVGNMVHLAAGGSDRSNRVVREVLLELEAEGIIAIEWLPSVTRGQPRSRISRGGSGSASTSVEAGDASWVEPCPAAELLDALDLGEVDPDHPAAAHGDADMPPVAPGGNLECARPVDHNVASREDQPDWSEGASPPDELA